MKCQILLIVAFLVISSRGTSQNLLLELKEDIIDEIHRLFKTYILGDYFYGEQTVEDVITENGTTYDFIVIGSGPSGSVMANRLSEIPEWKILLIEAGEDPSLITDVPVLSCGTLLWTGYNWGYRAEKQDGFCRGCPGQTMNWPHGKVLGGTTIINYMLFTRGNHLDYDKWADMGNPGWSYKEVLPYFLKFEDAHLEKIDRGYHRKGGYLSVSDVPIRSKAIDVYIDAAQEAGHPYVDYNGKNQMGVSYVQTALRKGRRHSADKAFLRPVRHRGNLVITTKSTAVEILIHPDTKEAYGVKYVKNYVEYTAVAKKEVILSAGSLNSPQVLMLSGIGPKEHLKELGIPVKRDLPVGQKMYDHVTFPGVIYVVNETITYSLEEIILNLHKYIYEYLFYGKGVLTTAGFVEGFTYIKTNASQDPNPNYPDMELIFAGATFSTIRGLLYRDFFNIPKYVYDVMWKPLEHKNAYQVTVSIVEKKMEKMFEKKNNCDKFMFSDYTYADPENHDIKTVIAAIREIQRINSQPSLRKYGATIVTTKIPGCEEYTFDTDEYWECGIRTLTATLVHQVATCKMGPHNDKEAVVDAKLRVHGIKNLRVVDTSVIPMPITAHLMAPGYMIGEKGADIVKERWLSNH
ncbi:hypothetical protein NQ318_002288 [Aromia moschata]|uniref:Glucose-methanol-choline oxidoreductase N-terminal domain-containing protein n=1 Tax=Aromia moschata TaxID=1265417 RepID=A0AAV8Z2X5_9CUCU|nr:hypothetical protein NQ318_002288 [Aromia moschata]